MTDEEPPLTSVPPARTRPPTAILDEPAIETAGEPFDATSTLPPVTVTLEESVNESDTPLGAVTHKPQASVATAVDCAGDPDEAKSIRTVDATATDTTTPIETRPISRGPLTANALKTVAFNLIYTRTFAIAEFVNIPTFALTGSPTR
jgi:hypothetical protein